MKYPLNVIRIIGSVYERKGSVMKKRQMINRIVVFLAAALLLITAGCSGNTTKSDDDSLKKVMDAKRLVLGLDDNYPPMGYTDDSGEIVGFDIDLAQEVCQRLDISLVKQPIQWDEKEKELNNGTIDCIWNGLSVTPERAESMCLSKPYFRNELVLVVMSDSDIKNAKDIKGKKVGVQSGSTPQKYLETSWQEPDITIETFGNNMELMQSLKQGDVDAAFVCSINAYYFISMSEERFFVLPDSFCEEELAIGFRKNDQALCHKVEDIIGEMKADGTLKKISEKWFDSDITIVK